jgi:hypothetical protein
MMNMDSKTVDSNDGYGFEDDGYEAMKMDSKKGSGFEVYDGFVEGDGFEVAVDS